MDKTVENKTLWAIGIGAMVCAVIAVSNQVWADEKNQKDDSKIILTHPADKVGVVVEEKKIEQAEENQKGNILKTKEEAAEEKTMGPELHKNWPSPKPQSNS